MRWFLGHPRPQILKRFKKASPNFDEISTSFSGDNEISLWFRKSPIILLKKGKNSSLLVHVSRYYQHRKPNFIKFRGTPNPIPNFWRDAERHPHFSSQNFQGVCEFLSPITPPKNLQYLRNVIYDNDVDIKIYPSWFS